MTIRKGQRGAMASLKSVRVSKLEDDPSSRQGVLKLWQIRDVGRDLRPCDLVAQVLR